MIEIENYRAFRGRFYVDLPDGCNLLVYGENGVGKTSLYNTLVDFFESPERQLKVDVNRHRFNTDPALVRLGFTAPSAGAVPSSAKTYEWSQAKNDPRAPEMRTIDKGKGCLDYRALLRVHLLPSGEESINLFELFLNPVLAHFRNPASSPSLTFLEEWKRIKGAFKPYERKPSNLDDWVEKFNAGFERVSKDAVAEASELLKNFDKELVVEIEFTPASYKWRPKKQLIPPKIVAKPIFKAMPHADYYAFLNEARLSAIAITIYFAGLKISPATGLRVLVLDDVLIGLDMANRMTILGLGEKLFSDWQVIILTYHRAWFEVLKARTKDGKWIQPWRSITLRNGRSVGIECPISVVDSGTFLSQARQHFAQGDFKAAAVYARSAWEEALSWYCAQWHLQVVYVESRRQLDTEAFLRSITKHLATIRVSQDREWADCVLQEIRHARRFVLNPNAHYDPEAEDEISAEITAGIRAVEDFELLIRCVNESDFTKADEEPENGGVEFLIKAALEHLVAGRFAGALDALARGFEMHLDELFRLRDEMVPYGMKVTRRNLFTRLGGTKTFSKTTWLRLKHASPYLLGEVTPSSVVPGAFDSAANLFTQLRLHFLISKKASGK